MEKKAKTVLSLFSGCGGMDLGFEGDFRVHKSSVNPKIHPTWYSKKPDGDWITLPRTSFHTVFANDILKSAETCWQTNFPSSADKPRLFRRDSIVDLVKQAWEGTFEFPSVDVVTGGFPCQDFSLAGNRKGFLSKKDHNGEVIANINAPTIETRGMLYYWMRNVIELILPSVFVAENVKGLVSLGDTKKIIEHDFRNVGPGYIVVEAKILNAKNYGVPQNRERVIFIGLRTDRLTDEATEVYTSENVPDNYDLYPLETHGKNDSTFANIPVLPFSTTRSYLSDLGEPSESKDLSHQIYSRAKFYGKHCQGNREINLDDVSPTIRSEHHGNIEFRRLSAINGGRILEELSKGYSERRLSVRECARIQTFPDNFKFVVKEDNSPRYQINGSDAYKLIGNAVPPLLAYHLASRMEHLWPIIFKE
jgi:DNA (cytosine-5)-methyltransferase 1